VNGHDDADKFGWSVHESTDEDHRGLAGARMRQEGAEVGVRRDDHTLVSSGEVDELGIGRARRPKVTDVDRVVPGPAEQFGDAWEWFSSTRNLARVLGARSDGRWWPRPRTGEPA
jgi:hypothetical protein